MIAANNKTVPIKKSLKAQHIQDFFSVPRFAKCALITKGYLHQPSFDKFISKKGAILSEIKSP